MSDESKNRPILIEIEDEPLPDVSAAPEIAEFGGEAMQGAIARMAEPRTRSGWAGWALAAGMSLLSLVLGVAAWDFVNNLIARLPVLGWLAAGLAVAFVVALLALALRELIGFRRVRKLDRLRTRAATSIDARDLIEARAVAAEVARLYRATPPDPDEALDAETMIERAEVALLSAPDARVVAEIQSAARQVALATALVPLAFADVAAALTANLRMIRRIAEIYGGRPGALGNWRLAKAVALHLMATGLVAVGDDLIGSLAGGGLLSKLSRRFGEGVVNGALTARVGLAAMDLCRPLPFRMGQRPGVSTLTATALKGLFDRG